MDALGRYARLFEGLARSSAIDGRNDMNLIKGRVGAAFDETYGMNRHIRRRQSYGCWHAPIRAGVAIAGNDRYRRAERLQRAQGSRGELGVTVALQIDHAPHQVERHGLAMRLELQLLTGCLLIVRQRFVHPEPLRLWPKVHSGAIAENTSDRLTRFSCTNDHRVTESFKMGA